MESPDVVPREAYMRAVEAMKAYEELFNVPATYTPERLIRAGMLGMAMFDDIERLGLDQSQ